MRQSGLDWSTRPPTSSFYAPSQAEEPSESFFKDHAELEREVLNPLPWIERSVVSFVPVSECPDEPHTGETEVNEALVRNATAAIP